MNQVDREKEEEEHVSQYLSQGTGDHSLPPAQSSPLCEIQPKEVVEQIPTHLEVSASSKDLASETRR